MMTIKEFNECTQKLRSSSMFYMSLGSKELFHSNFIFWLSIINFDVFLSVMHNLANVNTFWWENDFKPNLNNIEVRREFHNFDLSIYINVGNKTRRNGDSYDVWLPVLILENKMKSLAYQDQLDGYLGKVYEEWCDFYKGNIEKQWSKDRVSFVVLSLIKPQYLSNSKYKNIECSWARKDYDELSNYFHDQIVSIKRDFDKQIIEDYCGFIKALFELANNDWTISPKDYYISKVCPKDCEDVEEKSKMEQLAELRIYDIREKIIYDQLVNLLQQKLVQEDLISKLKIKVERYSKDSYNTYKTASQSTNLPKIICNTNFFHSVGLFEAIYLIRGRRSAKDEPFFLTIQIQGNQYTRGISRKNILKIESQTQIVEGKRKNKEKSKKINTINGLTDEGKGKLKFYIDIEDSKNIFGKYGDSFIYTKRDIGNEFTIEDLIDAVVENMIEIVNNEKDLNESTMFNNC